MIFDGKKVTNEDGETSDSLETSWEGKLRAVPEILLAPLYNKIRIPFETIHYTVSAFNGIIEALRSVGSIDLTEELEWDIFLTTVNKIKGKICSSSKLAGSYKKEVLLDEMPRFIWQATASCNGEKILDLLFDATDIEQGNFFIRPIEYNSKFAISLRVNSALMIDKGYIINTMPSWKILNWFASQVPIIKKIIT